MSSFQRSRINLGQRCVVRVMVLVNGVIISTIVHTEKCPTAQIAVIFVTRVKDVAVEVQRITSKHKNRQFLLIILTLHCHVIMLQHISTNTIRKILKSQCYTNVIQHLNKNQY